MIEQLSPPTVGDVVMEPNGSLTYYPPKGFTLTGGDGHDTMTGGLRPDFFRGGLGTNTVTDFSSGDLKVDTR